MTFIEFVSADYPSPGATHHFVGKDLSNIFADTNGGTEFGFATFSSHREIEEREARELNLGFLEQGIAAVQRGCKSFKLKTPR